VIGCVIVYLSCCFLVDSIVQATFDTGRADYPFVVLADFVVNTRAAADEDTGFWLVGTYGRAGALNTYAVSYTFGRVERDAVVSAFNFSDMGPATNVTMNMLTFSFKPADRLNLDFTAILTTPLVRPPGIPTSGDASLKRIQLDARVGF
jgi:hypothetical protein